MHLEVRIGRDDVHRLIRQFAPIRIHMTPTDEDRRWIELDEPHAIAMIPERGVSVTCSGRVRYALGPVKLPLSIRSIGILLRPLISKSDTGHHRLEFELQIEDSDLVAIPGVVDQAIMNRVNSALTPEATRMIWEFGATLTKSFQLPNRLEPLDRFDLVVNDAHVTVDELGLLLHVEMGAGLSRTKPRPTDD